MMPSVSLGTPGLCYTYARAVSNNTAKLHYLAG